MAKKKKVVLENPPLHILNKEHREAEAKRKKKAK